MSKLRNLTGKFLNKLWGVNAKHALYREDGKWYHRLREFPGALFDANGFVIFETEREFIESPYLQIQQDVHLPEGIASIPKYIRITEKSQLQTISQTAKKVSQKQKSYKTKKRQVFDKPKGQLDVMHIFIESERIVRDTKVSLWVKYVHEYKCQICGTSLQIGNDQFYAESHHVKPLGNGHNGPDVVENIICVCPNHHALLDLGAIYIDQLQLRSVAGHDINSEYITYHNTVIYKKGR